MTDLLTHLSLPLTAVLVSRRDMDLFAWPPALLLGGVGAVGDVDKFLGVPGLSHSLVTLGPLAALVLGGEYVWRGEFEYGPIVAALLLSHLVLDFFDGGPVPLLFPFVKAGVGLQYPATIAFGQGLLGVAIRGPLVDLRVVAPEPGFHSYGFLRGYGLLNVGLLAAVYWSLFGGRVDWSLPGGEG